MVAPMKNVQFYDPRYGAFAGLSNLHPRPLTFNDVVYATPEHAYQAAKARDPRVRDWLIAAPTPELAAVAGDALKSSEITEGWEDQHVALMERIVRAKFAEHPDLLDLLLSTGNAKIVEWAPEDGAIARFWGEFEGQGSNVLGRLLMKLRDEHRTSRTQRGRG
jgi:ribA/ribD-fused uncharacterized protein